MISLWNLKNTFHICCCQMSLLTKRAKPNDIEFWKQFALDYCYQHYFISFPFKWLKKKTVMRFVFIILEDYYKKPPACLNTTKKWLNRLDGSIFPLCLLLSCRIAVFYSMYRITRLLHSPFTLIYAECKENKNRFYSSKLCKTSS